MLYTFTENRGVDDPNLFEGDMRLTPEQRKELLASVLQKRGAQRWGQWPNGVLIFTISPTLGKKFR